MEKRSYSFANEAWKQELTQAYSFRFTETPDFKQKSDHIAIGANSDHREGFDNITLLTKEVYSAGAKATLHCQFEDLGCPEIIIAKQPELCSDGAVRYGECFEVVLWKNGVNVWRHFYDKENGCSWHKRLGLRMPVEEHKMHELTMTITEGHIIFTIDGVRALLRVEDLFERFYFGVSACEGIVRLYDFCIEDATELPDPSQNE
ncbi:MAG: hypothetical protein IKC31_05000 [Clostridia bacterium]|nr:hypothetical protein [Clostridia bacterium]